jgi:alpha-L-fucosidase 2
VIDRLTQACKDGYDYIKEKHFEDYKNLFDRVKLSIDNSFAPLYFQYGRYLLISSSRKGSLPSNLQGIWNEDMQPAWDSKFTININTEMNYWSAETCSLPECHLPLFEHLKRMWKNGKYVADKMYGCRGFVAHHNTDLWGDCAPQDIYIPATYWVMGGAWLCTHIWNHYLYTNDKNFLQEMYPILKDAVLFFHDYLIEVNGELVTCPSVSPENTYIMPSGVKGCICYGSSMDIQILRDLFDGYLKASKELDIYDEIFEKTKEIINKLPKINIGKYGQIMEWQEDYDETEPGHRHISQLYALHPSHQITIEETPKLAKAAAKTLERRLSYGGGHTGWSRAWIVNLYARLHDGENALKNLNELWEKSTFENLMDNHPFRGGYVFQIDGNFGATAAIAEMLVQSYEDKVIILPALPKQWENGKVTGLTICGGAKIDIEWKNGELLTYNIYSDRDMVLTIIYKNQNKRIEVKR